MALLKEMIQNGTCRHNDKLQKVCAPLFDAFHLNYFGYLKMKEDGRYFYLGTNAAWGEYFAAEKLYLNYPYFRHPKFFYNGISLPWSVKNAGYKKVLDPAKNQFGLHHSLILVNKIVDGIEGIAVSLKNYSEIHQALLIQEVPLLRLFIQKFKEETKRIYSQMEDDQVDLIGLLGNQFYEPCESLQPKLTAKDIFLKNLGIAQPVSLTTREIDVVKLLIKGYSAQQIARQLYLSKRTIEHHIERIKDKLSCRGKAELIQKANDLVVYGRL